MDRDKMREEMESWFMENVDCEDDHFFPRDKARYFTKNLLSLPALREMMEKARKWDAYQTELAKEKAHTERFISLMDAEEDELRRDAAKWRKVEEIAKYTDKDCTDGPAGCRAYDVCTGGLCHSAFDVVEALKESDYDQA